MPYTELSLPVSKQDLRKDPSAPAEKWASEMGWEEAPGY